MMSSDGVSKSYCKQKDAPFGILKFFTIFFPCQSLFRLLFLQAMLSLTLSGVRLMQFVVYCHNVGEVQWFRMGGEGDSDALA